MTSASPALKVLWVARQFPVPTDSGDRLYSLGLAQSLSQAGADVAFIGLTDPQAQPSDLKRLPSSVRWLGVPGKSFGRLRTVFSRLPFEAKRFATPAYARMLGETLASGDFKIVVLDHYSAVWALPYLRGRPLSIAAVAHNCESQVSRRIAADYRGNRLQKIALSWNARRTARAERQLLQAASLVVTITDADAASLTAMGARKTLTLSPGYGGPVADLNAPLPPDRRVVLLGSYRWLAKQMNLRAFLRAADAPFAQAGIKLQVIGDLPPDLRAELEPGLQATELLGFVADPHALMDAARIGVVPEATGGGFKLKILDYVFAGVAVAGLSEALEALPANLRRCTALADDLDHLTRLICELIGDDARLTSLRREALTQSLTLFDWRERGRRLLEALAPTSTPSAAGDRPSSRHADS